ncbi:protein phosphatase 2C [Nitzschia inconspicua]|uniref:Protein phosphatase 2C n=1 Tax=Nitzschia inconspicua TaxID=303405 RepID=A0A9K3PAN7_9STRA|nr:protein phosphatase 2C [Nitzschia inconspicua]KAG7340120.1 protein phosphatase 2C [Nitzschia inconspicua]
MECEKREDNNHDKSDMVMGSTAVVDSNGNRSSSSCSISINCNNQLFESDSVPLSDEVQQKQQKQKQQKHATLHPPIILVSTCEEMNPSRRCTFEDCAVYAPAGSWNVPDPNMAFLAVCDGHGGRQMVEYLEDGLIFHVAAELNATDEHESSSSSNNNRQFQDNDTNRILRRLEQAFLMADIHSKTLGIATSGATVAVCLITRSSTNTTTTTATLTATSGSPSSDQEPTNDSTTDTNTTAAPQDSWTIYAANAGDARIVLGHAGTAYRMTKDHRTDDPDEVRRIEQSGGFLFKGRVLGVLAVTRSLGDHCMKEYVIAMPYTKAKTIVKDAMSDVSFVILACDGLWDVMSDQEAVDFVSKYQNSKESVAQELVKEALERGSTDNITVSVAWI